MSNAELELPSSTISSAAAMISAGLVEKEKAEQVFMETTPPFMPGRQTCDPTITPPSLP